MSEVWVLGGGGVAGIAWEIGILTGLADEGVTVAADAVLIGTSAGAVVGAQIAGGTPVSELYERQRAGVPYETSRGAGFADLLRLTRASLLARGPEQAAIRIGRLALAAETASPAERTPAGQAAAGNGAVGAGLSTRLHHIVQARLPNHEWTDVDLRIVAVDAGSGIARVFTRVDGVPLVDAVAASCAVPFVSVPVTIAGHRYMDGGMRSTLNLDLAPGSGPVIALAPSTAAIGTWARIPKQRAALGKDRRVEIVYRDAASKQAQGRSVSDPSVVPALVAAGREQGRREAARVKALTGRER